MSLGTAGAQAEAQALGACKDSQCAGLKMAATALCVYQKCKTENQPCAKTGTMGCQDMLKCAQACPQGGGACYLDCTDKGSYDGKVVALTVLACIEKNCPDAKTQADLQQCLFTSCPTEAFACK